MTDPETLVRIAGVALAYLLTPPGTPPIGTLPGPPMQVSEEALAKARAVDDIRASFLQGDAEPDFQRRVIEHAMHVLVAEHRIETISQARVEAVLENVLDYRP
jgi:hypothetical protein